MISDDGILPWLDRLRSEVAGLELVDAHTHLGSNDPDGYRCARPELVEALEHIDGRAIVFPMQEPDGYPPANDMVLREAEQSGGRLVAFCRLDPHDNALAEAKRALAAGARGIKLHPRAERFGLDHPGLAPVFALAHERGLPVLCHAGRGIPALGRHAVEACSRHPGMRLILAHAGISDLAWIWRDAREHPNLFFDTAWWSASDIQALLALVPPGQVLMASDAPYSSPAWGATATMRHGLQVGLDDAQLRGVLGGQAARLVAGEEPLDLGPPPGTENLSRDPLLERVYAFLTSALGQMFQGVEPTELLALARLACGVGVNVPQAPICESILALLDEREVYNPSDDGRPARFAPGLQFVVAGAVLARTPDVPVPGSFQSAGPRTNISKPASG
ncbi:MAG TPA: amidohydrolase family protein [Thermoleophilaceae bacterium]|nr:amidohydrolase family protein [Thermoleophilaceae bacterium]